MMNFFSAMPIMYQLIVVAILLCLAGALLGAVHHKIYQSGYSACVSELSIAQIKSGEIHEEIENKIMGISDPDLDKRLSKWMRD